MDERRVIRRLVRVFDANAGARSALVDSSRKLFRVKGCSLCEITHGVLGERAGWTSCREALGADVEYLHRDELDEEIEKVVGDALPCVLADAGGGLEMLLGPEVLDRCAGSIDDFRGRLMHHAARVGMTIEGLSV